MFQSKRLILCELGLLCDGPSAISPCVLAHRGPYATASSRGRRRALCMACQLHHSGVVPRRPR
eukprot:6240127-Prymnesium_polylepis.1